MANDVCNNGSCGTGGWNGPLPGDPDNSSVLSAVSDYGGIQLSWTVPNINGYAVSYTRIFRSTGNEFATAIPLPPVSGCTFFDRSAAEVIRPYHYWIQNVSANGTELAVIGPVTATAMPLINQVIQALANSVESSMLAASLRSRIDKIAELEVGLTNTNTTLETETGVLSTELLGLRNDLADAIAYVQESRTIEITERQALVTQLNTQLAQIGSGDFSDLYAAIEEETTTRALETGELFAQKILKFDLAGNVSGYGLSAHLDPDGTSTSDFQVRADTFSLAPPSVVQDTAPTSVYNGKVWVDTSVTPNVTRWYNTTAGAWQTTPVKGAVPFIVKTAPEVIDGFTVPPGVYIDTALIGKLTADKIDARGLSIKDPDGNIILAAGSSLDWSKLGGAANNLSGLGYTGALDATRNVYRGAWSTATVYKAGDVTTNAGSSWSARVDHTSSNGTNNPPTLPTTSNTWWELSAAKGDIGSTGPASISAVLSNEAHVFPAAADGTVSSYTGSGTEIRVYEGATELAYDGVGTANGTWKVTSAVVNITAGTLTDSGTYLTVGAHAGVAAGTDTSSITYTITGKTASGTGFTLTKTQTFTKSKQGAGGSTGLTGPAGPAVVVNSNRATTFTSTDGTLDAAQADIVFTASVSGVASPTYVWSFSGFQTAPTNSGSATQTITSAQFGTAKAATVRLTVNGTYQDDVTIVRLEKSTAAAGATVGAPAGTTVGGTAAETVAVKALAALQKTGDTITGRINMSVADGLFAGTDLNNGIYLGNSGLVGKKAGVTTFAVDTAGNAVFAGEIAAGSIDVEKLSGTSTSYDTPGTYSFTLPAGFTVMRVTLWAGGGGGGGARSIVGKHDHFPYQACGGGGGQGGRFVATFTGLTPGATYTVVVGAGGSTGQVVLDNSGVYTAPASAASGGNSSISGPGISAVAYGGAGGTSGYPINWGGDYVSGSGGSGGAGGGAGSDGAAGTGYAGGVEDGGTGGGNRNIVFGDWTTTPLETLGIGGNGLRGYGAIYGGPLGHRDPESGRGGFCQIEAYNPNGIIKRSEWDTLIAHLNARFTSYTWP